MSAIVGRLTGFEPGTALPEREVHVTRDDLAGWAAAAEDDTTFHLDDSAATNSGFERPVAHGPWKSAVLSRHLTDWAGSRSWVESLDCKYRRPDFVDDTLRFGGVVTATETHPGSTRLTCEVWVRQAGGERSVTGNAVVVVAAHAAGGSRALPMDELRRAVRLGHEAGRFTYRVEVNDVERFVEAVAGHHLPPSDVGALPIVAPPTYFAAIDPVERRDLDLDGFLHELGLVMVGGGNAFNEVDYERPIRVGDVLTVATTYTEVYEKEGTSGQLLFRVRQNEIRDEAGDLVARTRCGHVLAFDGEDSAEADHGA